MSEYQIENCPECNKIVFLSTKGIIKHHYEDYKKTKLHDSYKCHNFKNYKKVFERLEDDVAQLREHIKQINEIMFQ